MPRRGNGAPTRRDSHAVLTSTIHSFPCSFFTITFMVNPGVEVTTRGGGEGGGVISRRNCGGRAKRVGRAGPRREGDQVSRNSGVSGWTDGRWRILRAGEVIFCVRRTRGGAASSASSAAAPSSSTFTSGRGSSGATRISILA